MTNASIATIYKVAKAGEEAGFAVDQMIAMLHAELSMKNLIHLIERDEPPPVFVPNSSCWIV